MIIRLDPAELHLPAGRERLGAGRDPRLLEDLHPRRLRDRALPQADVPGASSPTTRSSAPATTRRSIRTTGGTVIYGPAGRPAAPAAADDRPAAATCARPGNFSARVGPAWWDVRAATTPTSPSRWDADPLADPVRFIDERTAAAPLLRKALRYLFPDHWSFLLGEVALYAFIVLIATGIYLALFFDPSTAKTVYHGSYAPLRRADDERRLQVGGRPLASAYKAGLLMRQTHHWAADVFVAAIVIHLMRVFFTGAFRKPRELTWLVGLIAAVHRRCSRAISATRWSTTCCRAWAWRSATASALSIPVIGGPLDPGHLRRAVPGQAAASESRMFIAHVFLFPVLLADADRRPSGAGRRPPPHPVQGEPSGTTEQADRRRADVPRPGAALAGADVLRRRPSSSCSAGSCRSTRSGSGGRSSRGWRPTARSRTGTWAG